MNARPGSEPLVSPQMRVAAAWRSRSPQERTTIAVAALILGVALVLSVLLALGRARSELRGNVIPVLREHASLLDRHAAEYQRLRAAPPAAVSPTDLRTLVQAQAGAAGLSRSLQSVEAPDAEHVKVVFGAIAFAEWLSWLQNLEPQQVRVETCRIEALATPGLVSVTATLVRPGQQ
jgi:type II secretory pathway component PulM